MRFRVKTTGVVLSILACVGLLLVLLVGKVEFLQEETTTANSQVAVSHQYFDFQPQQKTTSNSKASTASKESETRLKQLTTAPNPNPTLSNQASTPSKVTKNQNTIKQTLNSSVKTTAAFAAYKPRYEIAWANSTNFGERFAKDVYGNFLTNPPIIVIHETAATASSTINFFKTPHDDESVQASYHSMIALDGTVVYLVPPEKRAFGAANSVFEGALGSETVQTNPHLPPSVNNFAYHIGLETPPSGLDANTKESAHSGYTDAQYYSLAWLVAQSNVPDERITTHKAVDRSGQKIDPRSFDSEKFLNILHSFRILTPANTPAG